MVVLVIPLLVIAALLVVRALTPSTTSPHVARMERYGLAVGGDVVQTAVLLDYGEQPKGRLAAIGSRVIPRLAADRVARLRANLLAAGNYTTTAETMIGIQVLVGIGAVLLGIVMLAAGGVVGIAGFGLCLYCGLALPPTILARRARQRLTRIDREMPELVDLLVVGVEAGLGLVASVDRAAQRMNGPLRDELNLVLEEHALGASTTVAFSHLADRCQTDGVRAFARTLVQGERLGVSIGAMLRAIALEMRKRRRARAEELAQKAPIKILFPLVFFIFPSLLIVLMAPAILSIMDSFGA